MFTTSNGTTKEIENMNRFFSKNFDATKDNIVDHINKADIVPIYYRNLTPENQQMLNNFINTLSDADRAKIMIVR